MAERHAPYAPQHRRQMVEWVRTGRAPGEPAVGEQAEWGEIMLDNRKN